MDYLTKAQAKYLSETLYEVAKSIEDIHLDLDLKKTIDLPKKDIRKRIQQVVWQLQNL